jgi:adenine-specific DNA-methyltransferase
MPTRDWIGKNAVRRHHRTVPYHLLKCDRELSVGDLGGGNVLTHAVARDLPAHNGPRVVYGEACRLSAISLKQYGITFKQVPFELKVD